MLIKILLVIAIVIQCVATGYALRLVRTTKYNSVWILFIVGFSLLSVERLIQLLLVSGFEVIPRWWFGYLGIVISVHLSSLSQVLTHFSMYHRSHMSMLTSQRMYTR